MPPAMSGSRAPLTVDTAIGRRLVLMKQVFQNAMALSREATDISRVLAVLQLDFSVETLLKIVVSALGPASRYPGQQRGYAFPIPRLQSERYSPRLDFSRLFDEVVALYRDPDKGISKDGPPLRTEIQNFHEVRNDVQHKGSVPSGEDVVRAANYAESFIRTVIHDVFAKTLDEILLSDMVSYPELKSLIREAEQTLASGQHKESCTASAKAFRVLTLLEERLQFKRGGYGFRRFTRFNHF